MLSVFAEQTDNDRASIRWLNWVLTLSQIAKQLRHQLADCAAGWNMGDTELFLLLVCRSAKTDGIIQNDLSQRVGTSRAQTSALVESLRQRGLLECSTSKNDRRLKLWRLSTKGIKTVNQILQQLDSIVTPRITPIPESQVRELCLALSSLVMDVKGDILPFSVETLSAPPDFVREAG